VLGSKTFWLLSEECSGACDFEWVSMLLVLDVPDAWGGVCIEEDACSKITLASLSEM